MGDLMDMKALFKLAEYVDFFDVVNLNDSHEDYISEGGRYAWVYQAAHFIASIVVGLLEKADRLRTP